MAEFHVDLFDSNWGKKRKKGKRRLVSQQAVKRKERERGRERTDVNTTNQPALVSNCDLHIITILVRLSVKSDGVVDIVSVRENICRAPQT